MELCEFTVQDVMGVPVVHQTLCYLFQLRGCEFDLLGFPVWLLATLVGLFHRYLAAGPGDVFLGMS